VNTSPVLLALNVSQLRNLRNWARADLPAMVLTAVIPVERRLSVAAGIDAVGALVRAHEGLRSRLVCDSDGVSWQEVLPPDAVDVRCRLEVVEGPASWATLPVSPTESAFRGVLHARDGLVVAIKLSLSHVFVDALGKQAAARHLRQLVERRSARVPKQASAFARGPDDPEVLCNTEHWKHLLADAPRSCTYGPAEREPVEPVRVVRRRLMSDEARRLRTACVRLGVSPHTAWVTALSVVVGAMSGCQRQVCRTTYANRVTPADFSAVVQVAQPVFPRIAGHERDSLSARTRTVEQALAAAKSHGMYDANALLDWLNSAANARGAVFQPAFEVNFVPTVDRPEALHGPAADEVRFEEARIDPFAAKPEIVLLVRHLPEPLVQLTTRRPVHRQRDASGIVEDCLRVVDAMAERPEAKCAELGIQPLPATNSLWRGHHSGVAVDVAMTRALATSAPGVDACDVELCPNGRVRARMRTARDLASLEAWMRERQPWYSGSVVPDELVSDRATAPEPWS
jgi:hypothetical protein